MSDLRWLDDSEDPALLALRRGLDETERFTHSEVMQRRVWTRVSDPARTRRATRVAFVRGALVASALTALVVVAVERASVRGSGVKEANATKLAPEAAGAGTAALAMAVPAGAVVETNAGERVVRLLSRGARAEVAPSTLMALDAQGRPELRRGEVRFSVTATSTDDAQRFSVRVLSYRVVVGGARFAVKAETQSVTVAVEEGVAEIWNGSRMVRIGPGETWSGASLPQRETGGNARGGAPRGARAHSLALAPSASGASGPQRLDQDGDDLAAARSARAAADPRRALAIYEHLATRTGPAAENAMYEIGGIYHDQLRQPGKAVAAWDRYRARYPNGLLRAEADLSVIDTLATLDDNPRTLNEALAFLKRYPTSERRGEVARVVGDLYRGRGNCRAALDFYRIAAGAKITSDDADDASFGKAACLYALRDDGAALALRGYLTQNPRGRHARDAERLLGDKDVP